MKFRNITILAAEFAILVFVAGSVVALARNSHDFLLAKRQAVLRPLLPDMPIELSGTGDQTAILLGDWDRSGPAGALARGRTAVLALKLPPHRPSILTLSGWFPAPSRFVRRIELSLDGRSIGSLSVAGPPGGARCRWSVVLPPATTTLSLLRFSSEPAGAETRFQNEPMLGLVSVGLTRAATMPRCDGGAALALAGERNDGPAD
jgi:hypothetical protein